MTFVGGFSQPKKPSQEELQILHQHRGQIQLEIGCQLEQAEVISHSIQIVAGTNHKYMVKRGEQQFEVVIFLPLPHTGESSQLSGVRKL